MTNPMKQLAGMLLDIREGKFRPDGIVTTRPGAVPAPQTEVGGDSELSAFQGNPSLESWNKIYSVDLEDVDTPDLPELCPSPVISALGSDVAVQASAGGFRDAMRSEPEPLDFNFEVTEITTLSELQGALDNLQKIVQMILPVSRMQKFFIQPRLIVTLIQRSLSFLETCFRTRRAGCCTV